MALDRNTNQEINATLDIIPQEVLFNEIFPHLTSSDLISLSQSCQSHKEFVDRYFKNSYEKLFNASCYEIAQYKVKNEGLSWQAVFINDFNSEIKDLAEIIQQIVKCIIHNNLEKLQATVENTQQAEQGMWKWSWSRSLACALFNSIIVPGQSPLSSGYLLHFISHMGSQEIRNFIFNNLAKLEESDIKEIDKSVGYFCKEWLTHDLCWRIICNQPIAANQYDATLINTYKPDQPIPHYDGISLLHLAVYAGNKAAVAAFLATREVNINHKSFAGNPLNIALRHGYAGIAQLLLDEPSIQLKNVDKHEGSAEYNHAAWHGLIHIMAQLEQRLPYTTINYFYIALQHAVSRHAKTSTPAIHYLIKKCKLSQKDWFKLMDLAIMGSNYHAVKCLLQHADMRLALPDIFLHHFYDFRESLLDDDSYEKNRHYLIDEELKKHINAKNKDGYTALLLAVAHLHYNNHDNGKEVLQMIIKLLNAGANLLIACNGQTALNIFEKRLAELTKKGIQISCINEIRQCLNQGLQDITEATVNFNPVMISPLVEEMKEEADAVDAADKPIAMKFVQLTEKAIQHPNIENLNQLTEQAHIAQQHSSEGIRKIGIAMMAVGALLAIAGCVVTGLTLAGATTGVLAPLATLGLPLGITLAATGVALCSAGLGLFIAHRAAPVSQEPTPAALAPSI